ncbi:helix-turn-helix transcriptional regulator [Streptomyces sp. NPDC001455]|uniref:helix-turn-helix domain-containing protein n=1 Tax=unclassified Streptomyces TaxID=2593676 RepID=UPI00332BCD42
MHPAPPKTDDEVLDAVGPRLRVPRGGRGITLADVAATTGVLGSTLFRLENGQRRPPLELLPLLSRIYDVPLDDLVGAPRTGDPRIPSADDAGGLEPPVRGCEAVEPGPGGRVVTAAGEFHVVRITECSQQCACHERRRMRAGPTGGPGGTRSMTASFQWSRHRRGAFRHRPVGPAFGRTAWGVPGRLPMTISRQPAHMPWTRLCRSGDV